MDHNNSYFSRSPWLWSKYLVFICTYCPQSIDIWRALWGVWRLSTASITQPIWTDRTRKHWRWTMRIEYVILGFWQMVLIIFRWKTAYLILMKTCFIFGGYITYACKGMRLCRFKSFDQTGQSIAKDQDSWIISPRIVELHWLCFNSISVF